MRHLRLSILVIGFLFLMGITPLAKAQEAPTSTVPPLLLMTDFPSQTVGSNETVSIDLILRTGTESQIVELSLENLPQDWTATFRGKNRVVQSVTVVPEQDATVVLKLDIPANTPADTYRFLVVAKGNHTTSELPVTLIVQEKAPANLSLTPELPTVRNKPDAIFRYNVDVKNDSEEDLTVDLAATLPDGFMVTFKSGTQEVTSLPVEANGQKRISVELDPLMDDLTPSGDYPFSITAQGGDLVATSNLMAEVVGESRLLFSTSDDRLSGEIQAGQETPITLVLSNVGSAPSRNIQLSSTPPNGWTVTFEPEVIPQLQAGGQVEVMAHTQPSDKALAGDYALTFRASPEDGAAKSLDYRATVRTSTVWGVVGIGLIAVAVGAVGLAVTRFGRR